MPLSSDAFDTVVRHGAMIPHGMPRFDELTDAEMADLRQYIRSRSAELRLTSTTPAQH